MSGATPWSRTTPKGHGTEARARKHYRDGEKPCEACRVARNQAKALQNAARKQREQATR